MRTTTAARRARPRRSGRGRDLVILCGVVGALASVGLVSNALASPAEHKVTICHATASRTNPYVEITVDYHSITQAGHSGHVGPIFDPASTTRWGDIIPPFDFGDGASFDGANWSDDGQAIVSNGCRVGSPTTSSSDTTSTTIATTTTTENT